MIDVHSPDTPARAPAATTATTTASEKHVVIVAPQFPPCNLTAGHRARLFAQCLPALGFRTTVLTIEPRCYEEPLDWELTKLVGDRVRVVRTPALPIRPIRWVGDYGIRSFWFHYRALARLARCEGVDLVYIPIPPMYSALLGPLIKRWLGIPYVIDYIDPWIYPITDAERKSWKGRLSHWLAQRLEPLAVRHADGITAVAPAYYEGVVERNPHLRAVPRLGIPYGANPDDHAYIERTQRRSAVLDRLDLAGRRVLVYAGAILPRGLETLRVLFDGCRRLREARPEAAAQMRLLFVGGGSKVGDAVESPVAALAAEAGIDELVLEVAERQPYLEVLALLARAHAVLVLGSTERHYTASKVFQALHSGRPILALFHRESSAVPMVRGLAGVDLFTFENENELRQQSPAVAQALERLLAAPADQKVQRDAMRLDSLSARQMTEQLAECFRSVLNRKNS